MALEIIAPNEPMPVNAIKVYIYGDPSMGKSSLGMTTRKALIIDADKGAYRTGALRRAPVQIAENWIQVANLTEQDLEPFDTIVIDTIGRLLEMVRSHLANDSRNTKGDGSLKLNVQGTANNIFQTFVNRMIGYGKNVVFLAHATEDKDDDLVIRRPDLGGKNRQEIYRLSDCMAYFTYEANQKGRSNRVLKFGWGANYHSKDCANLGNVNVPDLADNPTFLGDLIDSIKTHLNTLTPEQRKSVESEQTWIHFMQLCNEAQYASDINNLMELMAENVEHPQYLNKNMWYAIQKAAKDLNMVYDQQRKRWFETEAQ